MSGFKININQEEHSLGIARGVFLIILDSRFGTLSGFGSDLLNGTELCIDDIILNGYDDIEIIPAKVEQNSLSIKVKEKEDSELLKEYYRLAKLLKNEGKI